MKHTNKSKLRLLLAGGLVMSVQCLVGQQLVFPELAAQERAAEEQLPEEESIAERVEEEPAPLTPEPPEPMIPLTEPPQDLKDESGEYELDLVDPFQRGRTSPTVEQAEEGLTSTSLGEISEEFRILAIIIPEGSDREPMALIRLQDESSPQVVMKDDLVQIKRRPEDRRQPFRMRANSNASQDQTAFEESALNALESYSFYLHIKDIQPTFIEAYQKKSPNETIILRW